MTKEELEQLRSLKIEIKELEAELRDIPKTTDSVRGSTVNHPYIEHTIVIEGPDKKLDRELYDKLSMKILKRKYELNRMEDWLNGINDSQMRTILKLYYKDGLTWKEVAFKIGHYDEQYPRKKCDQFLKKYEKYEDNVLK